MKTVFFKEQYKFWTAIAEYWINPDRISKELHQGSRKRKFDNESVASLSCMSPITNPLSFSSPCMNIDSATAGARKRQDKEHHKRQKPFTDDTLSERGALCCRLDHSLDHFCELPLEHKHVYCGLHKWAKNKVTTKGLTFCPSCELHLCVECYSIFHRFPNLKGMKTKLKNKFRWCLAAIDCSWLL